MWPFQIWRFQSNLFFDSYFNQNEAQRKEIINVFKHLDDNSPTAKAMFEKYIYNGLPNTKITIAYKKEKFETEIGYGYYRD
jgi:hypothetical protein